MSRSMFRALAGALALLTAQALAAVPQVDWLEASTESDVQRALAQAQGAGKPLLLYWGAVWCPPCNQLKATLFNRADFIERTKSLVPVHIDGDRPGAQQLGARFKVRGYPTLLLLKPDGSEITRLPGEAEPAEVLALMQQGLAGGRSAQAVLADARAGKPLPGAEWRMLAYYGWDIDESQLVPAAQRPALLAQLAQACPASEPQAAMRLRLKALAASEPGAAHPAASRDAVLALLADPTAARAQMDVLVNYAQEITRALAPQPGAERGRLAAAFDAALRRLQGDATLSRGDRASALLSRVELARGEQPGKQVQPKLPRALLDEVRAMAASFDREIQDPYERQAVITTVAYLQGRSGLWADSDALLRASLARSPAPHYLIGDLAGNARQQGRNAEALRLYEQAARQAQGPAAKLQWGTMYLGALVELAPQDEARIEAVAGQLLADALADSAGLQQRNLTRLQALAKRLVAWNDKGRHAAAFARVQGRLREGCAQLPAQGTPRSTCEALLRDGAPPT